MPAAKRRTDETMKIIIADNSGFCFGVRRAIDLALSFSKKVGEVYTIGPIIHNPQVVRKLEAEGIRVARRAGDIRKNENVIIRAHGVPKKTLRILEGKGTRILDATCPYVTRSKKYAEELSKEGYRVVIIGNPKHPEIKYISSYVPDNKVLLKSYPDAEKVGFSKKLGVITQTTQSPENFRKIVSKLLKYSNEFKIFNTICPDAINRQKEAQRLAKKTGLMLIIGGRNSANTVRLAAISKKIQAKTHHIEEPKDLKKEWFKNVRAVGIVTGASTPQWLIESVVEKIKNFDLNKKSKY